MSEYLWNRLTPDTCECGFELKLHVNGKCPWDRDELEAMRRIRYHNRRAARNVHEPHCRVPHGGSECSCTEEVKT